MMRLSSSIPSTATKSTFHAIPQLCFVVLFVAIFKARNNAISTFVRCTIRISHFVSFEVFVTIVDCDSCHVRNIVCDGRRVLKVLCTIVAHLLSPHVGGTIIIIVVFVMNTKSWHSPSTSSPKENLGVQNLDFPFRPMDTTSDKENRTYKNWVMCRFETSKLGSKLKSMDATLAHDKSREFKTLQHCRSGIFTTLFR